MTPVLLFALLLCSCACAAAQDASSALKITSVSPDVTTVGQYQKLEIRVGLEGWTGDPFDPDQIAVDAAVEGPEGEKTSVPGFWYQAYERRLEGGRETLTPKGKPGWRICFAPQQVGRYTLTVTAEDGAHHQAQGKPVTFECVKSDDPGFVRVSPDDHRYFAFDSGRPYVPIGANVCWAGSRGTFGYDHWLPRYFEAGCNYFRVWLGPAWTTLALETKRVSDMDLANAWRLDYVLGEARRLGLYVMLCLDSFNELREARDGGYPFWDKTPHNRAIGGPLAEPKDFWTSPEMARAYRNKLRYLVARYGWDTHVMSWELWNEVDIISPSAWVPKEVADWHARMGSYLRQIDPYHHLRTTSFAHSPGVSEIDALPEMDFTQTHNYNSPDIPAALTRFEEAKDVYAKPHFAGEFGIDSHGSDVTVDPKGVGLHNGIWSTLLSGSAGTAMSWWWDGLIGPFHLYHHFASLAAFVKGVDFPREGFRRIQGAQIEQDHAGQRAAAADLRVSGLRGHNLALVWVQNTRSKPGSPEPDTGPPSVLTLPDWPPGEWTVTIWDTWAGKAISTREAGEKGGAFSIDLPGFRRDLAVRIERIP